MQSCNKPTDIYIYVYMHIYIYIYTYVYLYIILLFHCGCGLGVTIISTLIYLNLEQQSLWNKNFPKFKAHSIEVYKLSHSSEDCFPLCALQVWVKWTSCNQYFGDFASVHWTSRTPCAISFPSHLVASLAGVVCHHNPPNSLDLTGWEVQNYQWTIMICH